MPLAKQFHIPPGIFFRDILGAIIGHIIPAVYWFDPRPAVTVEPFVPNFCSPHVFAVTPQRMDVITITTRILFQCVEKRHASSTHDDLFPLNEMPSTWGLPFEKYSDVAFLRHSEFSPRPELNRLSAPVKLSLRSRRGRFGFGHDLPMQLFDPLLSVCELFGSQRLSQKIAALGCI